MKSTGDRIEIRPRNSGYCRIGGVFNPEIPSSSTYQKPGGTRRIVKSAR